MAKRLFLTADTDSVTLSDAGFTVFGGTGNQTVKLTSAATGATLDANIERVELSGNLSAYTFKAVSGTGLQIYSGSTLVGTIGSLNQNATVAFADGSAALLQTGATTFTLGGQTVTTSATAAAITGATVNASDKSTVAVTIPTFSVTAGAATALEDGNATFTVSLNQAQTAATTVTLALTGTGGATIGTDTGTMTASGATLSGNVLTFAAGSTSAIVTVPVTFDSTTETGEGISMALSAPTGVTGIVASSTAATVALSDVSTPTFTLTSNTVSGTPTQEGGSILFTITPSSIVDKDTVLTVNLAGATVGAITAQASASDFSAAQTVTFLAGDKAARTTSISVTSDSSTEGIEGYKASLLDSAFAEKSSVTGTITDATATYVLTGPTSVNEGASATYTVTSSLAAPTGGVTIPYTLSGNATLTTDYTGSSAATGNITIAAGATTGTLILNAVADNTTEATAENVIVTLGTPSTGNVTTGTVTTTIADTSQGVAAGAVALSSSATAVDEGSAVTYTVTVGTAAPTGGLSIPYTLSGTSTLTSDYTGPSATTGNITIAAGATTGTLVATTVADTTTEGAETLIVTLGTMPSGYTLTSGQGVSTTTINDTSTTVVGQTFALTTGVDTIPGLVGSLGTTSTAGNDTVNAYIDAAASTDTFTAADVINAGDGVDTLAITTDGAAAGALPASTISNVEVFSIREVGGGTAGVYDFSLVNGETSVINRVSTDQVSLSNLGTGTVVTVKGDGASTNGLTIFTMASTTAAVNLTIDGGVTGAPGIQRNQTGAATVTINSTGAANAAGTIDLDTGTLLTGLTINATSNLTASLAADYAASSTLTGTGSAVIDLTGATLSTNITTVTASSMTAPGALKVALGANTTSFVGGAGDDAVWVDALVIGASKTVAAGSGTGDLLRLTDQAALTTTTAQYITGFEVLRLADDNDGALDTFDMSVLSGLTSLQLDADSAGDGYTINNMTAAQAAAVTIRGTQNVTPTFGVLGGSTGLTSATTVNQIDTLGLTIDDGATATSTITVANLTAAGVEKVNVTMNDHLTLSSMTGLGGLTEMTFLASSKNLSVTSGVLALNANTSIDASAVTGTVTLDFNAATTNGASLKGSATAANVIKGGVGADAIVGGTGVDTVTSKGSGADTVDFASDSAADSFLLATVLGKTTFTNFDAGTATSTEDIVTVSAAAAGNGGEVEVTAAAAQGALTDDRTYVIKQTVGSAGQLTSSGTLSLTTADFTATTLTNVAAYLSERFTDAADDSTNVVIFMNNGTNTYAYALTGASTSTTITAAELVLVGVFNGAILNASDVAQA